MSADDIGQSERRECGPCLLRCARTAALAVQVAGAGACGGTSREPVAQIVIADELMPDARTVFDSEEIVLDGQTGMLRARGAALIHHLECGRGLARIMDATQEQEC